MVRVPPFVEKGEGEESIRCWLLGHGASWGDGPFDFTQCCAHPCHGPQQPIYRLQAYVVHIPEDDVLPSNAATNGHFVAYFAACGRWYRADNSVTTDRTAEVVAPFQYLCFFERVDQAESLIPPNPIGAEVLSCHSSDSGDVSSEEDDAGIVVQADLGKPPAKRRKTEHPQGNPVHPGVKLYRIHGKQPVPAVPPTSSALIHWTACPGGDEANRSGRKQARRKPDARPNAQRVDGGVRGVRLLAADARGPPHAAQWSLPTRRLELHSQANKCRHQEVLR